MQKPYIKWQGFKYKVVNVKDSVNKDGEYVCRRCKSVANQVVVTEFIQFGFEMDIYTDLLVCSNCSAHTALISRTLHEVE